MSTLVYLYDNDYFNNTDRCEGGDELVKLLCNGNDKFTHYGSAIKHNDIMYKIVTIKYGVTMKLVGGEGIMIVTKMNTCDLDEHILNMRRYGKYE